MFPKVLLKKAEKSEEFACPEPGCGRSFSKKFLLKTHSAIHTDSKPWVCLECKKSFALKSRLKRHAKIHQGYLCDKPNCNQKFGKWSDLRKHAAKEHPRTHRCAECGADFKLPKYLRKHQETHEKSEKCPVEGCQIRVSQWRLTKHLKESHESQRKVALTPILTSKGTVEVRRHGCGECGKDFLKPSHLLRHKEEVHQGVKKEIQKMLECTVEGCGRKFRTKTKFESHANWHRGERPFFCPENGCHKKFCGRDGLGKHLRKCHGKTLAYVIEEFKMTASELE